MGYAQQRWRPSTVSRHDACPLACIAHFHIPGLGHSLIAHARSATRTQFTLIGAPAGDRMRVPQHSWRRCSLLGARRVHFRVGAVPVLWNGRQAHHEPHRPGARVTGRSECVGCDRVGRSGDQSRDSPCLPPQNLDRRPLPRQECLLTPLLHPQVLHALDETLPVIEYNTWICHFPEASFLTEVRLLRVILGRASRWAAM